MIEDDFIGKQFPTPKGGILTVRRIDCASKSKAKKYICECSICSLDKELWPKDSILAHKSNLVKGKIPCGCASTPRWKECQNHIRVRRLCEELGYIFYGWIGAYKGTKTYLDLENPETGNRWNTTIISSFLLGQGDPELKGTKISMSKKKSDDYHIENFMSTGSYLTGTTFKRLSLKEWSYMCPKCSNDEYVEAGLCNGVFYSSQSNLYSGTKNCRCQKGFKFTEQQYVYQISKICEDEGLVFHGWVEGFKGADSIVKYTCAKGHLNTKTRLGHFKEGVRCKKCAHLRNKGAFNGYQPERSLDDGDHLYLIRLIFEEGDSCVKCGRTFHLKNRLKTNRNSSEAKDIIVLKVWTGIHDSVWELEQEIKNYMIDKRLSFYEGDCWKGSSECYEDVDKVIDYIIKQASDSNLTEYIIG